MEIHNETSYKHKTPTVVWGWIARTHTGSVLHLLIFSSSNSICPDQTWAEGFGVFYRRGMGRLMVCCKRELGVISLPRHEGDFVRRDALRLSGRSDSTMCLPLAIPRWRMGRRTTPGWAESQVFAPKLTSEREVFPFITFVLRTLLLVLLTYYLSICDPQLLDPEYMNNPKGVFQARS
jgi:hypothetical protein